MGTPNFRYKLTDSPDYKPPCGDEYTERQLRILNREIALSEVRTSELTKLKSKALTFGDEENYELAVALYEEKLYPAEKHFWDSWTVEYAQKVLQDLTPWDRSYLTKQKYRFVSETDSLKGKPYVLSRGEWLKCSKQGVKGYIEFVSLQDLKGSMYFGGHLDKLKEVRDNDWSVLVIDEAHEGVDTLKTDTAFDHIKRKFTLHLSGTPFKLLDALPYAKEGTLQQKLDELFG